MGPSSNRINALFDYFKHIQQTKSISQIIAEYSAPWEAIFCPFRKRKNPRFRNGFLTLSTGTTYT